MRRVVLAALLVIGCGRSSAPAASDVPADARVPPDAMVPDAAPPPRLSWVDPARCLSPCAFDPGETLVRVDDHGKPAPAGAHRINRSVVEPLARLLAAARAAGFAVTVTSAYRSYDEQVKVFRTTKQVGRAARPGHSEHQLGTAIDLDLPTKKAVAWLAEHAADHGFVVSFPPDKQRITGVRPENWHVRYVGEDLAAEVMRSGGTIVELLRARPELGRVGTCADCPSEESRAACGAVTAAGECDGPVLRWCHDGALAAVDCRAGGRRCAQAPDAGVFDCVP